MCVCECGYWAEFALTAAHAAALSSEVGGFILRGSNTLNGPRAKKKKKKSRTEAVELFLKNDQS